MTGNIDLGEGNNSLTNSGVITGQVQTGSGSDIVKNTGTFSIIDLGEGADTLIGGSKQEQVLDSLGNDTYKLGGGSDILFLSSGNDACDGGAGTDSVGFNVAGTPNCFINLDSKAIVLGGQTLQASLLSSVAVGVSSSIKNFERATGGRGDDYIAGNSAANSLTGSDGNDVLYGGLGADRLAGGSENDTFVYLQTKESGLTKATRDIISAFDRPGATAGDLIDLSAIDADTKTAGNQSFNWTNSNIAFTHAAGELRAVFEGNDTIIQGDVNGDAKPDFAITVLGIQFFSAADFVP